MQHRRNRIVQSKTRSRKGADALPGASSDKQSSDNKGIALSRPGVIRKGNKSEKENLKGESGND
jgi:hypothetical protein